MDSFFASLGIGATGMKAQRMRMDIIAANIANAHTTRTPEGGPYKRKDLVFAALPYDEGGQPKSFLDMLIKAGEEEKDPQGVYVATIVEDKGEPKMVYDPDHPDANAEGYVAYPNIDVVKEMVNLLSASRSYEANVTVMNAAKSMALKTLDIGRV